MTDNQMDDNKSAQGNNKPEVKEPNFPEIDKGQVKPENQDTTPQDPELAKWIKQTKDLPNAYKRVKGAESEVERWRREAEAKEKAYNELQQQLSAELKQVYEKDPDTFSKVFGLEQPASKEGKQEVPIPDAAQIARQVQAKIEVDNFYTRNQGYISDENEWNDIQDVALSFVGKKEKSGKPYTIQTALRDSLILRHPELIGDKAVMEHLTSQAKRESASEPGDIPSGSSSNDVEATQEELTIWRAMGGETLVKQMLEEKRTQGSR